MILAALRRPVVLAKAVATLDVLSGGRLDLGVGVGWQREEYEAAGLDFDARGRLLDHTLHVCTTLWRESRAKYDSPELRFDAIHLMPKPLQSGGVPIWVSGTITRPVVNRLARFGSGWIPWGSAADDVATAIPKMKQLLADAGGNPIGLKVVGHLPLARRNYGQLDLARTMEKAPRLAEQGVTDLRVNINLPSDASAAKDMLIALVAAFRQAVGRESVILSDSARGFL